MYVLNNVLTSLRVSLHRILIYHTATEYRLNFNIPGFKTLFWKYDKSQKICHPNFSQFAEGYWHKALVCLNYWTVFLGSSESIRRNWRLFKFTSHNSVQRLLVLEVGCVSKTGKDAICLAHRPSQSKKKIIKKLQGNIYLLCLEPCPAPVPQSLCFILFVINLGPPLSPTTWSLLFAKQTFWFSKEW